MSAASIVSDKLKLCSEYVASGVDWQDPDVQRLNKIYFEELRNYSANILKESNEGNIIGFIWTDMNLLPNNLCPPVPNRLNYLLWLSDLIDNPDMNNDRKQVLDVGVGASCIYPLLGYVNFQWDFTGTDIDERNIIIARENVMLNKLQDHIKLFYVQNSQQVQKHISIILKKYFQYKKVHKALSKRKFLGRITKSMDTPTMEKLLKISENAKIPLETGGTNIHNDIEESLSLDLGQLVRMTVHPSHNRGDWEDVCDKNSGNTSTRTLSAAPLTSTNTVEATSPTGGSTSTTRAPVSESAEDRSTNTFAYPSDPSAHASPSRGPIREALNAMGHGDVVRECEARYLSSLERCHGTVSDIAAGGAEEHGEDPAPALIVDAVMCNPPFYDLEEEIEESHRTVCTGSAGEMRTEGGEEAFVTAMIIDSLILGPRVGWCTSLLGHKRSLRHLLRVLRALGVRNTRSTRLLQGRTVRWVIAWKTWYSANERPSEAIPRQFKVFGKRKGGASGRDDRQADGPPSQLSESISVSVHRLGLRERALPLEKERCHSTVSQTCARYMRLWVCDSTSEAAKGQAVARRHGIVPTAAHSNPLSTGQGLRPIIDQQGSSRGDALSATEHCEGRGLTTGHQMEQPDLDDGFAWLCDLWLVADRVRTSLEENYARGGQTRQEDWRLVSGNDEWKILPSETAALDCSPATSGELSAGAAGDSMEMANAAEICGRSDGPLVGRKRVRAVEGSCAEVSREDLEDEVEVGVTAIRWNRSAAVVGRVVVSGGGGMDRERAEGGAHTSIDCAPFSKPHVMGQGDTQGSDAWQLNIGVTVKCDDESEVERPSESEDRAGKSVGRAAEGGSLIAVAVTAQWVPSKDFDPGTLDGSGEKRNRLRSILDSVKNDVLRDNRRWRRALDRFKSGDREVRLPPG